MEIVSVTMEKEICVEVSMAAKEVVSADLTQILLDLDSLNGETIGTTADDKITFAEGWRDDVKDSIAAYGVSMTGAKPADYDGKIALIGAAVAAPLKSALDAANEEVSADLTAGIALVDANYGAIKDALTAKGVDMTGIIPSDYDYAVASIVCAAEGNAVEADVTAGKTFSNATSTGLTGTRAPAMIQASGQAGTDAGGVAYPSPRFVDNGDGTITDKLTGLMWAKNLNLAASDFGRYASWTEAKATCEGKNIGGHTDWRLPNNKEIDSLLNWSGFPLSSYLNLSGFTNSSGHSLWTNTVAQNDASYAFWVSSFNGVRNADVKTALYGYVPVRGPIAL